MLPNIKCSFNAQEFLDSLDLRFLLCKICPHAKLENGYGGIKGICRDCVKQGEYKGERLLPVDEGCLMHDIYESIKIAACKLDSVFEIIRHYGGENIDKVRSKLK